MNVLVINIAYIFILALVFLYVPFLTYFAVLITVTLWKGYVCSFSFLISLFKRYINKFYESL